MGVVVCNGTNPQGNRTKRDSNGSARYDFGACVAGKFPEKRHVRADRQKGVRRDSGGRGWVRMGTGGCIDTRQTQNKAKRAIHGRTGHIWYNRLCGGNGHKDDVVATWPPQGMQGCSGGTRCVQATHIACANNPQEKRTRNNKKKAKTSNFILLKKMYKNEKEIKQQKILKKNIKREQEDRTSNATRSKYTVKPKRKKEAGEKRKKLHSTGTVVTNNSANKNSAKWEWTKWTKKIVRNEKKKQSTVSPPTNNLF